MAEEKKKGRFIGFFKDCKRELKNIVWSPKKDVVKNTTVAVLYIAIAGVAIWGLGVGFSSLLNLLVK